MATVVALCCALVGCTYSDEEPGLFGHPPPSSPPPIRASTPVDRTPSPPNPNLPVVGQAVWTSGDGLAIQLRIAVHAVRRIEGGTVLDWSVTPLRGPNLGVGDAVPQGLNLGLSRFGEGTTNVFLIDAFRRKVYRPLTHAQPRELQHCLCSPIWLAQRNLRIGQTTLLQVAYPEIPEGLHTVDVDIATVPLFWHVPVTPTGMVPQATSPTELSRPAERSPVLASTAVFRYPRQQQQFLIHIDAVLASSTFTSLQWSLQSVTRGDGLEAATLPPIADDSLEETKRYNAVAATGPRIVPTNARSGPLRTRLMTTRLRDLGGLECLCSDLRLWATVMRSPRQTVSVVTNLPALPNGTTSVSVLLPGLPTLTRIPVTQAPDGTASSAGPLERRSKAWTYTASDPPAGWSPDQWPTPLPRSSQLKGYVATVDDLVG